MNQAMHKIALFEPANEVWKLVYKEKVIKNVKLQCTDIASFLTKLKKIQRKHIEEIEQPSNIPYAKDN